MSGRTWSGREVRQARAMWRARLPVACCRCGRPVIPDPSKGKDEGWQVDHYPISREFGGTQTWPAHSHCNTSDGGKRGAQITNARRRASQPIVKNSERANNIRGL